MQSKLGPWMLTMLVIGNMIGSGIFLLPASLAHYGSISLIAGLLSAIGAILLALVFAKLSTLVPKNGGPYAYATIGFGDYVGFNTVYSYWIALWLGCAAIVIVLAAYFRAYVPTLATPVNTCLIGIVAVWLVTMINMLGLRVAGIVQIITTLLKLLPLLVICVFGWRYFHADYLGQNFNISGQSNLAAIAHSGTLALWAFIGLESATIPYTMSLSPSRNIPRATIIGTVVVAVLYLLVSLIIMGMISADALNKSTSPLILIAEVILGRCGGWIIAIFAIISCIGTLNGWILMSSQITQAAADNKMFPSVFSVRNRYEVPAWGMVINAILISLTLVLTINTDLLYQFDFIILVATLASLLPYAYSCLTEILLLHNTPGLAPSERKLHGCIAAGALIFAWWTLFGSGKEALIYMLIFVLLSAPWYILQRLAKRHN